MMTTMAAAKALMPVREYTCVLPPRLGLTESTQALAGPPAGAPRYSLPGSPASMTSRLFTISLALDDFFVPSIARGSPFSQVFACST